MAEHENGAVILCAQAAENFLEKRVHRQSIFFGHLGDVGQAVEHDKGAGRFLDPVGERLIEWQLLRRAIVGDFRERDVMAWQAPCLDRQLGERSRRCASHCVRMRALVTL